MNPQPNYSKSLEFLEQWRLGGPWLLVAIDPTKRGACKGRLCTTLDEAKAFIERYGNERWNIHFTVNPLREDLTRPHKKPSKSDIKEMGCFHIDIDPVEGRDLNEEQDVSQEISGADWDSDS